MSFRINKGPRKGNNLIMFSFYVIVYMVRAMENIGIIAEYNPFHLGHLYQIKKVKEKFPNSRIIVLVSSYFSQRGELIMCDKWERTKVLLDNMVDLVVEFPFAYASQSADTFAKYAVKILGILQINYLIFGVEQLDVESIHEMALLQINNKEYDTLVKELLDSGYNYPTATGTAIKKMMSRKIERPNDILALAYMKEIIRQNLPIIPIGIKRTNNYHDTNVKDDIISGSAIRNLLKEEKDIDKYVVSEEGIYKYKEVNREKLFPLLKYQIINNSQDLEKYNMVNEGIENRIKKVIVKAKSWEELVFMIKTKRYTYNSINRMLVHILTNFTKEENNKIELDYIRILGFTINGQRHLNEIKKDIDIPIITRYKEGISLLLDIEFRVNNIYSLLVNENEEFIRREYTNRPIIKK